jgi:Uma2 family endonuclease
MEWQTVCEDPLLRDLPYKIELNEYGAMVMSPASNKHGLIQIALAIMISKIITSGKLIAECSISTKKGIKVPDLIWASDEFMQENGTSTPYLMAPEICIEIFSPSNSRDEMMEKKDLYFMKGAREFWLCSEDGNIEIHDYKGRRKISAIWPDCPLQVIP